MANVTELVNHLMEADSCCEEAKEACKAYLAAVGTNGEADAAKALAAELSEDIVSIDGLIGFAENHAPELMGPEAAAALLSAAKEAKANGEKTCICDACQTAKKIVAALEA